MYKEYDLVENNENGEYAGSIFGYVTEDIEQLRNFLDKNDYNDFNINKYKEKRIGIITNLYVEPKERNNGHGDSLVEQILYFCC